MQNLRNLLDKLEKENRLSKLSSLKHDIDIELSNLPSFTQERREFWDKTYAFHKYQIREGVKIMFLDIPNLFDFLVIAED
ncbi:hypothetical protein [Maribacter sp. ACAM166]|uniref:hypothetical protein n=1 Tax=Maribacter sp. ACAM166 TaxID=2508996 RepID=UPI0010FD90C7|nr:hypothetical protein [Maribacter sp. ACAM166]TLP74249.1 hypothetical protein ES765_16245 [Maribacter sp. ACAM166]